MAHTPRKRFGQNFLIDDQVINQIISTIAPKTDDNIIEIGPGKGALTFPTC
jgi:16S rRNA (adenine1518-N6/adenine1519-N6)-dimethyltransferase